MNIIFEGVNGSGKTTIIDAFKKNLDDKGQKYEYVSDLVYETPLTPILEYMFKSSVFLNMKENFKTSLFESLVLAANHHYIQERLRDSKLINIYDRDFISVLAYQKDIIKNEYVKWKEFYESFRNIMLFELKNVDLLTYVSIPIEENIKRTENRDNRKFSQKEIELLFKLKENMEEEIKAFHYLSGTDILYLDGREDPKVNVEKISNKILMLGGKK
ncbi:thymidylate kinase 1 [Firmicutes bacterium CAG:884]|nr:thymidylate kinase 1 [Firmicutes bacterium CAG:884]